MTKVFVFVKIYAIGNKDKLCLIKHNEHDSVNYMYFRPFYGIMYIIVIIKPLNV